MISISFVLVLFYLTHLSVCDERGSRIKRIVGGIPAEEPPPDDPTVFTNFAGRSARVQGVIDYPHYVFRGIKYAYAPVGKDRFLRPREKLLDGLINATLYAPPCVQPRPGTDQVIGSEDCLALNVFTPELPMGTEGLPVVVWIHGGGFRYGSASQYGVRHLVGKRLVVVTIQYRLGSLGFLSSGTKQLPGNVALWDMVLAVQWVRNYIGFFGGNPYKINVMGHGTGASSAVMVALSNVAKGVTSGVIAMSGTAVSNWAVDNSPQHTATDIAVQNGCPTTSSLIMVKCLQTLPADSIIRGDSGVEFTRLQDRGFMGGLSGGLGSAPVTEGVNDGRSLPGVVQEGGMDEMEKGSHGKIPLLTGICKDETKRAVKGPFKRDVAHRIKTVPDFLDTYLVQNLKKAIPLKMQLNIQEIQKRFKENFQKGIDNLENFVGKIIPPNFNNYMKVKTGNLLEALDKVADVTNDALFNVPAFLTVDKWASTGAPTFLYSFDHIGKNNKGHTFLRGCPLVGNDTHVEELNNTVSHGDDLSYLFDAYDVEGQPLETGPELTEDDLKVREIFTQMIADFARYGAPKVNNKPAAPFSAQKNNFIQIKPTPTLANNFKFCEMALWCNIAERLKSSACKFLKAVDASFKNMQNFVHGLQNQTDLTPEKVLDQLKMLKNASGQGINVFNQTQLANLAPDKVFKEINEKWKNMTSKLVPAHNIFDNKHEHKGLFNQNNNGGGLPNIFEKKPEPGVNIFDNKHDHKGLFNKDNNGGLPNIFEKKAEPENKPNHKGLFNQDNGGGFPNIFERKSEPAKGFPNLFEGMDKNKGKTEPKRIPNLFENKREAQATNRVQDPVSEILGGANNEHANVALFKNEDFGAIPKNVEVVDTSPDMLNKIL